jgi:N-acetylglutamate synthase-like GNAT family acetyltransferase
MSAFIIREALAKDADPIADLLKELGYPSTAAFARHKIAALSASASDTVLVAEGQGRVVGVAHLHLAELFHEKGLLGRVMAIVVNEEARQAGVGTKLMSSLEELARDTGCVKMEVTSGIQRDWAHAFYRKLGYIEEPKRFVKVLE